eukprot:2117607-Prymnesium_polylepis.2
MSSTGAAMVTGECKRIVETGTVSFFTSSDGYPHLRPPYSQRYFRNRVRHVGSHLRRLEVPSSDGCAAPLAASGSGEHARDVLPTPSARLLAGSSDTAVVTREKRWLGETERMDWAVRRARREPLRGVRERPPVLATFASGQAKHHPV